MADYKIGGKRAVPRHRTQSRRSSDRQERSIEKAKRQESKRIIRKESNVSDKEIDDNRMEAFQKLSDNPRLGHYLWDTRNTADAAFGEKGMGMALHSVVSVIINAYRKPELRKKLEEIVKAV